MKDNKKSTRSLATLDKLFRACKAGNDKVVAEILESSTDLDLNRAGNDGKTALFHTINGRRLNATRQLLKHNADPSITSFISFHRDRTSVQLIACDEPPIVTAARVKSVEILELLLEYDVNPDVQTCCHSHINGVQESDKTALHIAAEHSNVEMVSLLLKKDANVNILDRTNETALHISTRCRRCPEQSKIVQMLCEHGSDVNIPNKIACTPVYLAAFYGCLTKLEMLILYGADPDQVCERENSYGSAMHIAALKDRMPLAKMLIKYNCQLSRLNSDQYMPLQMNMTAHGKSDIAALLVYHGAELSGRDKDNYTLLATCIRIIRLDCEMLAPLMVYAGYDLSQDDWLQPGDDTFTVNWIPKGRVEALCNWLREQKSNPLPLMDRCRVVIRNTLRECSDDRSIVPAIAQLPLPTSLKDYLLLKALVANFDIL